MSQTVPRPCLPTGREKHPGRLRQTFSADPIYLVLLPLTGLGGIVHLIYLDDFIQISKNKKEAFKRFYYSVIICMLYIILGRSIEIYHIFYLTEKLFLHHFDYFILIFLLFLALMKFFINRKNSLM